MQNNYDFYRNVQRYTRIGSTRGSGHEIYKYWWVGSGPIELTTIFYFSTLTVHCAT